MLAGIACGLLVISPDVTGCFLGLPGALARKTIAASSAKGRDWLDEVSGQSIHSEVNLSLRPGCFV